MNKIVERTVSTTRVIKIGGRARLHPDLPATIAAAWRASPGATCVVHGGGDEVSTVQRRLGASPRFVGGRRFTSAEDIDVLRMTLSGTINKRLVTALVSEHLNAIGLSGEDARLITANQLDENTLGRVGTPASVNIGLLRHLMDGGYLPVISPLARDAQSRSGDALNVNGDDAAAAIAAALNARELLFVADVPGVLSNGSVLSSLDSESVEALIASGTAAGGMTAKLHAALSALERGVARVRIGDLAAIGDDTRGTTVTLTPSMV